MRAKKLSLCGFRNLEGGEICFEPGMNFLLGDNAQGKTNLLESLYLFARGKSFRGAKDEELVRFGEKGFRQELVFETKEREEKLFYAFCDKERVRRRNGMPLSRQSELIGHFRAVLFCPDDLQLMKGSPTQRRRFMDVAIAQCYPVYVDAFSLYNRYLTQRNSLLKQCQKSGLTSALSMQLSVFGEGLAKAAADIWEYRRDYCALLSVEAKEAMLRLSSERELMQLCYLSDIKNATTKQEALEEYRLLFSSFLQREQLAGVTLHGIHRDDIQIQINGKDARDYASQGQQRSAVLSLKLAEGSISAKLCGEEPVYLFDDVLSELDDGRKKLLLDGMNNTQFIVSGCDKAILGERDLAHVNFMRVSQGKIEQMS